MAYKNRSQGMKCKRIKDPILKQTTNDHFLTKALKEFTLIASRLERGREFDVPTTL